MQSYETQLRNRKKAKKKKKKNREGGGLGLGWPIGASKIHRVIPPLLETILFYFRHDLISLILLYSRLEPVHSWGREKFLETEARSWQLYGEGGDRRMIKAQIKMQET